jgi:hypothetical protein
VVRLPLRRDRVGHAVEDRLELVTRAAEVALGGGQPLVQARVVHRRGHPVGELAGEHQVALVVDAAGLGRRDRHRAERAAVRAERHDDHRGHAQRLQEAQVVLVGRDRGEQPLVHLGVKARLAVAHGRRGALGPAGVERVAPEQVPGELLPLHVAMHGGDLADSTWFVAQEDEAPVAELAGEQPRDLDHHHLGVERPVDHVADVGDQRVAQAGSSLAATAVGDPDRDRAAGDDRHQPGDVLGQLEEDVVRQPDGQAQHERVDGHQCRRSRGRAERGQQRPDHENADEQRVVARERVDGGDQRGGGEADNDPDPLAAALP